ncbi:DUF1735 domain-containing protein [Bacteroides sp.]|uniref:DUF1735 domain-containing protein n=1 Tax=Bacteroides sp. TaxID=29523 RepID=UPI0025C00906|nr:DUF1735 domain-containing protein [Bacteroides sp.]
MKKLTIVWVALISVLMTACYDDYEKDYEKSVVYFASQKPLRTLVADTDMSIKVGVAIGGKREVNTGDWATFEIDASLLNGTGLTLMPESYYQLANPNKMTISNSNLAIADVKVTFSDAFYNDDAALNTHYAIPFRLTDHNQDEVSTDVNGELKDYSIVVVKFVSQYHGTYFVKGKVTNLSTQQVTEYNNKDLSQNLTRDFVSLGRNKVRRPGFGQTLENNESVNLTVNSDGSVGIEAGGSAAITDATATLDPAAESLEFVGKQPKFTLSYKYTKNSVTYQVEEELIRRQNPEADLRFQEW